MQNQMKSRRCLSNDRRRRMSGFTLIELMVSLGVFLVIAGAAFSLVTQHMPVFTAQQNQSALNFNLRNAAAQMQIDMANAGSGFYPSADVTSSPIGVTVESPVTVSGCFDAENQTYGPECFDTLRVIKVDPKTPPAQIGKDGDDVFEDPDKISEQICSESTHIGRSSTLHVVPVPGVTENQLASKYKEDDQILVIQRNGDGIGTAILTKDGAVTGKKVKLSHNPTGDDGTNTADNDRYEISTADRKNNKLMGQFCHGDWVVRLSPVVYRVDATDASNPKLARLTPDDPECLPDAVPPFKAQCILAEQIIGFKVGALLRPGYFDPNVDNTEEEIENSSDCKPYCYSPDTYKEDWGAISAIRITIIGRTQPQKGSKYKNEFDKGPYKIEAVSVVVSPRSLTMRDER